MRTEKRPQFEAPTETLERKKRLQAQAAELRGKIKELEKLQERLKQEFSKYPNINDPGYITKEIEKMAGDIANIEVELIKEF